MRTALLFFFFCLSAEAQFNVTTQSYDTNRSGANTFETVLTTSNVNVGQFGKLFSVLLDAEATGQPLYVAGVMFGAASHNVVYIATLNNTVYAYDADNAQLLWSKSLGPKGTVSAQGQSMAGGVLSTMVVDPLGGTLYAVNLSSGTTYWLHALDMVTSVDKVAPMKITGSSGSLAFDPTQHLQRPALAFANGNVYVAFGSFADLTTWHGWVMAYNAGTLNWVATYCTTPTGVDGAIWMSGGGPVIDSSGNLIYMSGNGLYDGISNFGDSMVKLSPSLELLDWFTPDNYSSLQQKDNDLGSSSPLAIPGAGILLGGGKTNGLFVLNEGSLGHEAALNAQVLPPLNVGALYSAPAYWNGELYVWGTYLRAYTWNGSTFNTTPVSQGTIQTPATSYSGSISVSANGITAGTGIVWAYISTTGNNASTGPSALYAFDAADLTHELWSSSQNAARDATGCWEKWRAPVVVNGKVYVASAPNPTGGTCPTSPTLNIYGLLNSIIPPSSSTVQFVGSDVATEGNWPSKYGTSGYDVEGVTPSLPIGTTLSLKGRTATYTWVASTTDPRALKVSKTSSTGIAACWVGGVNIAVNFPDTSVHQVALYLLDWDSQSRSETIQVTDTAGNVLDSRYVQSFVNGEYLVWNVSGNVVFKSATNSGPNAVVNGLFFDPGNGSPPPPPPPPPPTTGTVTISLPSGVTATYPASTVIPAGQQGTITITVLNPGPGQLTVTTNQQ